MIVTPNMNNPVLVPTPPAKLKLSRGAIITPTKKKLKTSSYAVRAKRIKFGAEFEKQVLFTETIGMGDTVMLLVEKETSRQGGYMTPLIKAGIKMSFKPFSESMFDVACSTYLFLRESHENNEKHDMGYQAKNGHTYNRCGIFAWPSDNVLKEKQGVLDITVEKKFRDVCYELLAASSSKIPAEESIAVWDKSHSLTHKTFMQCGRLKSLDEVFIGESVANILYAIEHREEESVPIFGCQQTYYNIYKRRKSDGKYSKFCVNVFGFPEDSEFDVFDDWVSARLEDCADDNL